MSARAAGRLRPPRHRAAGAGSSPRSTARSALVVFRRADGAAQQVDLYVCGDPTAVRTLTLPAP